MQELYWRLQCALMQAGQAIAENYSMLLPDVAEGWLRVARACAAPIV